MNAEGRSHRHISWAVDSTGVSDVHFFVSGLISPETSQCACTIYCTNHSLNNLTKSNT